MRDARDNPFRTGTCRTCGGALILPRMGKSDRAKHEGAWLHLELPATLHIAVPIEAL